MRDLEPPFQFDLSNLVGRARRTFGKRIEGVSINLPFVSFSVAPADLEKQAAREIVIRLADRRILNAFECCDSCIDQALESLQRIRSLLVDKQVELAGCTDGALYLLIEFMLEGLRQFLTFEQRISSAGSRRPYESQKTYFAALEMLRAHLHRCLAQVSVVADIEIPRIADHMRYDASWQLEAYVVPPDSELGVGNG